jgi:DNA-binding MarR family transcriptional regulator
MGSSDAPTLEAPPLDTPSAAALAPDPRLEEWRMFLRAHALLSRRLDEELRSEQGMSLAEYDALFQLAAAPGGRLRMNQLADRVLLSRSGITRLVDRLVADGLVSRCQCSSDARGAEAVLTDNGLGRIRRARATHLRGVEHYFLDALSPAERAKLGRSLGTVVGRLGCDPAEDAAQSAADPDQAQSPAV